MIDTPKPESFEDFKKSFSYGSRTDLNFKFLSKLSDDQAAKFFQDLLRKLGDAIDDGNFAQIVKHVCEWQKKVYSSEDKKFTYDDGPFTPFQKRVSDSSLALITSSGHFVEGKDPEPLGAKNMTQQEAIERIGEFVKAPPQLSTLPVDTPGDKLRVRHGGYDIRGAQADPNVALPLQRLLELEHEGVVGQLVQQAYSFVGACSQKRLLKQIGPQWIEIFKQQPMDAALLVPV
ncbi:MAG: hypothetical protein GY850_14670 [bacterium]|nr:hypothetical protein [bacterium]